MSQDTSQTMTEIDLDYQIDTTSHNNEQNIAQQLLNAYLIDDGNKDITTMATILLQSLDSTASSLESSSTTSSPSNNNNNNQQLLFNFEPFMQLRSEQYTGIIEHHDQNLFNHRIFHAALYTNSPIIIDSIMPYMNVDFATLHDNYIINAITDAATKGHYQSIFHLINKYHLPSIIPQQHYDPINLFHYSTYSNNLQLIEYLLPLCFNSTSSNDLQLSLCNIAKNGHLHLIKELKDNHSVDLLHNIGDDILTNAIQSNNIELIDYLIEVIGFDPNANNSFALRDAIMSRNWEVVKHLITKYYTNIPVAFNPLSYIIQDKLITPDTFDSMTEILNIDMNSISQPLPFQGPLFFTLAQPNCNITIFKHLISKYMADPHYVYIYPDRLLSTLNWVLMYSDAISDGFVEMIEYLCELGVDVNQCDHHGRTPIESVLQLPSNPKQSILPIIKSLLKNGAKIDDVYELIETATRNHHWSTVQHLIETYQPHIKQESKFIKTNLLHDAVVTGYSNEPSLEFISFLLSLGIFDINGKNQQNKTPIQCALCNYQSFYPPNLGVIKLLIQNDAIVTIDHWIMLFDQILIAPDYTHIYFEILDYFKDTFGWDMDTFLSNNTNPIKIKPSVNRVKKFYTQMSGIKYRILLHRYKANVNEQDDDNNTVLHHLAGRQHIQLLRFSLSHSRYKPNIYAINKYGQNIIHKASIATEEGQFEDVLDLIIDFVTE